MHAIRRKITHLSLVVLAIVLAVTLLPSSAGNVSAMMGPMDTKIMCTTSTSPNPTFTLTAKDGYISTPDGNVLYMWGFSNGNGAYQYPGPILCVNQGDTVTVILNNSLKEDVSLVFPGLSSVMANGGPSQPVFSGTDIVSLAPAAAKLGGTKTYSFVAGQPGTFMYMSGSEPIKQVRMGLFGAIVVRPTMGANFAYNRADTIFNPDYEHLAFLSEVDPALSAAVEQGRAFNMNNYKARYFLMNGRGLPDTLAPNNASWLPSQPYSSLARLVPYEWGITRYLSAGVEDYPFHPHGKNGHVIARDGRLLEGPAAENLSYEKFSVPIGPGQTWDETYTWHDAESYDPVSNPVVGFPLTGQNIAAGMYWSGSPYLGSNAPFPPGQQGMNQCGEYYVIAHNHNLIQIMGYDIVMNGMGTFLRIDAPDPMNPTMPKPCP